MSKKEYGRGVTVGAFDLCHAGHILVFKEAKEVCDYLIVGLQDDPTIDSEYRIREKDGQIKNKPVMSLEERKIILEAIQVNRTNRVTCLTVELAESNGFPIMTQKYFIVPGTVTAMPIVGEMGWSRHFAKKCLRFLY